MLAFSAGACLATMLAWGFTGWEILVILLVILLLFGGRKLPELARGLARSLRVFRDEVHGVKREVDDALKEEPPPPAKKPQDKTPEEKPPKQGHEG